jgi:hypothetical protein
VEEGGRLKVGKGRRAKGKWVLIYWSIPKSVVGQV